MLPTAFKQNRLAVRMVAYLAPIAILPMLFALYSLSNHYRSVKKQSLVDNKMIASLLMEQFDQYIQQIDMVLQQAARNEIFGTDNLFLKREVLSSLTTLHQDIDKVLLVDSEQNILMGEPLDPMIEAKSFQESFGRPMPIPSESLEFIPDSDGKAPSFYIVKPVIMNASLKYLVARVKLNSWYTKTLETLSRKSIIVTLLPNDQNQTPLVISQEERPEILSFFGKLRADGLETTFNVEGETFDVIAEPSRLFPQHILVAQSRDAIMAKPHRLLISYLFLMAVLVGVVVFAVLKLIRQGATVDAELQLAEVVQRAMLSNETKMTHKSKLSYHYEPAAHLGGDWFYVFEDVHGRYLYALMGDITGHGLPQGIVSTAMNGAMCMVEQLIKTSTQKFQPKSFELVKLIDSTIRSLSSDGKITTTCLAIQVDLINSAIYVCNAGHTFPLILKHKSGVNIMSHLAKNQHGMLGLIQGGESEFTETRYHLDAGDLLVMYTDGLTEARDAQKATFRRALHRNLRNVRDYSEPAALKKEILRLLTAHTQGAAQIDDICFVIIQPVPLRHEERNRRRA